MIRARTRVTAFLKLAGVYIIAGILPATSKVGCYTDQ